MTNNILLKFAKKGINLSPDAYAKVMKSNNPVNLASELIVKLKSNDFKPVDLISVNGKTIDEITGNISTSSDEPAIQDNTHEVESGVESTDELPVPPLATGITDDPPPPNTCASVTACGLFLFAV